VSATILVVDDDPLLRRALKDRLAHWGHVVEDAPDGAAALAAAERREFDVVFLDLWMPGLAGMDVLARLREAAPGSDVVVLTAHGSLETAVAAVRAGAADFLQKPADFDLVKTRLDAVLDRRGHRRLTASLADTAGAEAGAVVRSPAMRALLELAGRAARSDAVVLLTGESGAGKQMLAESLHALSARSAGPFVYVNCVALSDELVESTLFGHERGAFTGAVARKPGRLELAQGGTAFLDEIGDTTERFQTKLLHFLETGEYERVGGTRTLRADCRVVAATNRDLAAEVERGRFRADLYYRLNVIRLHVPPLRERREDVRALVEAFVARFARESGKPPPRVPPALLPRLEAHRWPGNVRELKNVVERLVVLSVGDELDLAALPPEVGGTPAGSAPTTQLSFAEAVDAFRRETLRRALAAEGGNQTRAAERLGMQRSFLNRLMRELGLRESSATEADDPPEA
jgi:two-component system nitrogen regulation response regulator NtrX